MYSGSSNVVLKMFLIVFAWEVAMYQRRLTDSFFFWGGGGEGEKQRYYIPVSTIACI